MKSVSTTRLWPVAWAAGFLLALLMWQESADRYERVFFELSPNQTNVAGVAVYPKDIAEPLPTVVYLHGSRGRALGNGKVLREFADSGFACVTMDYSQADQDTFNREMVALHAWLDNQAWADRGRITWVGSSQGAQQMLRCFIKGQVQPTEGLVRIGGGLVEELKAETVDLGKNAASERTKVWLWHGERDRVFPLDQCHSVAAWFRAKGFPVTEWIVPEGEHGFGEDRAWIIRAMVDELADTFGRKRVQAASTQANGWLVVVTTGATGILLGMAFFKKRANESRWLRKLALCSVVLAVLTTVYHMVLPRYLKGEARAGLFLHALASNEEREDFKWLLTKTEFQTVSFQDLIQHVRLAHFRRGYLYEKIDLNLFRDYLLSPQIEPGNADFKWRWRLWLDIYPRVRKCVNAEEANRIVVRAVRERVGQPAESAEPREVAAIWSQGRAALATYHKVLVAALRSVGVAARLTTEGRSEFWNGQKWLPVLEGDPFIVI